MVVNYENDRGCICFYDNLVQLSKEHHVPFSKCDKGEIKVSMPPLNA